MVDFGGWEMPQQYTSIRDEHLAVRKCAGLFDVSHMGRLVVRGGGALEYLQRLLTNDIGIEVGRAVYTLMSNPEGGVIDDLIVYRPTESRYNVVVNASNREKDVAWMRGQLPSGVTLDDLTDQTGLLAFQGPMAEELLPASGLDRLAYFGCTDGDVAGVDALISRTGYTGEDGFELFIARESLGEVWDAILEKGRDAGVLPAGLGARDACRLEAALRLWGNDMDETVNAYEAGLGWTVKLDKGDFVGRSTLAAIKSAGPARQTLGVRGDGRAIPRHGTAVRLGEEEIGEVTSGTWSFLLEQGIGMARVSSGRVQAGDRVELELRGQPAAAEVVKLPFYRAPARDAVPSKS